MTFYIFGNLFYFSVIFANKSILNFPDDYSYMILPINFSVQYKNNIFNDFIITLYSSKNNNDNKNNKYYENNNNNKTNVEYNNNNNNDNINEIDIDDENYNITPNGYIIYNNYTFKDNNENEIISKINEEDPYNILIFENSNLTENFIDQVKNVSNTCDKFNLILYFLIIFFFVFMKITLIQYIFKLIRKIKTQKVNGTTTSAEHLISQINEDDDDNNSINNNNKNKHIYINPVLSFLNPINAFYYIFFHLSIVVIIPTIYPDFVEYKINNYYYGIVPNLFNSVYYYRSDYGKDNFENTKDLEDFIITNENKKKKSFLSHKSLDFSSYSPSNLNPYMINLIVMISSIWISQYFKPFDLDKNVQINEINVKFNKFAFFFKKFLIPLLLIGLWFFGFGYGMYYLLDYIYLFHRYLFFNKKKLFDYQISGFLVLFYYHVYFYILSIYYVCETIYKNKKAKNEIEKEKKEIQ
jgi:hypothetical protein